jgi:ATP/maltotriose-dependent transcriptional regulator MalT
VADRELQLAERELTTTPNDSLRSLVWLVRAEWDLESRRPREARASLEQASAAWTDTQREPSAVEARAFFGFINADEGRLDRGRELIRSSIEAARQLSNRALEARCRLFLAAIQIANGQLKEANEELSAIPADDGERIIGPELRAEAHYLQGRLHAARGDAAAAARSADAAKTVLRTLRERIPEHYRSSFAARRAIQRLNE